MNCVSKLTLTMTLALGTFLGPESLTVEYKEFRPNNIFNYMMTDDNYQEMIENNNWDLILDLTYGGVKDYITKYIPKYLVSFGNTSNIDNGTFYIGVTDSGEVTGISISPEFKKDNYASIRELIIERVKSTLTINSPQTSKSILDNIFIEFVELEYDSDLIDDNLNDLLDAYKKLNNAYNNAENEYNKKKSIWCKEFMFYKRAINDLVNDPQIRQEIIRHIEADTTVTCDPLIKTQILERLYDATPIMYVIGDVSVRKKDMSDITFWIINWREDKYASILSRKPSYHCAPRPDPPYFSVVRDYKPLITRMAKNGVKMTMIKITLPTKDNIDHWESLSYLDGSISKTSIRTVDINGSPCCVFNL
jgi:hypothetical protein